jgi:hypothetical protein
LRVVVVGIVSQINHIGAKINADGDEIIITVLTRIPCCAARPRAIARQVDNSGALHYIAEIP